MVKPDLNELPVGAAILELNGTIVAINRMLRLMLSYDEKQPPRQAATSYLFPEDRAWAFDLFAQLACGETDTITCCIRLNSETNEAVWALISAGLIKRRTEPHKQMLLIIQDMSLEKEMLDEMESSQPFDASHYLNTHLKSSG